MFENAINIQGREQLTFAAGGQYPERLLPGVYDVWADDDIYIKVDQNDASDVTTETGYLIRSGNTVPVQITSLSFLGAAGTGDVYFHQVK